MNLKWVWICVVISFVALVFPVISFAQKTGKFSGLIELTYQKDKIKDIDSETEKSSFIQEYKLQYQGHIYSPRLLRYNIGGTFRKEDSRTDESSAGRTDTTAKSRD